MIGFRSLTSSIVTLCLLCLTSAGVGTWLTSGVRTQAEEDFAAVEMHLDSLDDGSASSLSYWIDEWARAPLQALGWDDSTISDSLAAILDPRLVVSASPDRTRWTVDLFACVLNPPTGGSESKKVQAHSILAMSPVATATVVVDTEIDPVEAKITVEIRYPGGELARELANRIADRLQYVRDAADIRVVDLSS